MINWDQRGAGLSYHDNMDDKKMNIEQFISDTVELTKILLKEFKKEKIFLIGHSWGSVVGLCAVKRSPRLYYAYISAGQVVNIEETKKISQEYVLKEAKKRNREDAINELSNHPNDNATIDKWVFEFGGVFKQIDKIAYLFQNPVEHGIYKKEQSEKWEKGIVYSEEKLSAELENVNMKNEIKEIEIPVYFVAGKYDYVTPSSLIKEYFEMIKAPNKEFILFENSAHGMVFEEKELFYQTCLKIKNENR
jgi:pimeloyl-ACP methyl ester carboxylesterase